MQPFLGQITLFPYNFAPKGWMVCSGQQLPINQWTALFALIGTNFGGDGRTTFALPNLKAPAGNLQYCIAMQGVFPERP
jgi:microcystin-dependent protein